jgi:tetratricopeptide (TPR) repeat protein
MGRADWLARQTMVPAAIKSTELAPGNSAYLRHAAEILEANGLPEGGLRERAAAMNPLDSENWIRLAAGSELSGHQREAEQEFLHAFDVDHQLEPRWALANFYLRAGNSQASLAWARKTLEFDASDLTSVFQLCWAVSGNAGEILDKAVPRRAEVLAQYLEFLDLNGRVDDAGDVANVLLPLASAGQAPLLLAHCTKSLDSGNANAAIAVWNGLVGRRLIAEQPVEPAAGRPSADAGFQRAMTGQGFAWGAQREEGVSVERAGDRGGVRVVFARNEPEHASILGQWIALASNRIYQYRIAYAASGMDGAGLRWVIYSPQTKAVLMSAALPKDGPQSSMIEARFQSPAGGPRLARLELRYDREPGTVRPEGSIEFSNLVLKSEP